MKSFKSSSTIVLGVLASVLITLSIFSPASVAKQPNAPPQPQATPQTATLFATPYTYPADTDIYQQVLRYQITSAGDANLDLTITDPSLNHAYDLAFSPAGEMFVTNLGAYSEGHGVTRFLNPLGTTVFNGTIFSTSFASPRGVAFRGNEMFISNPGIQDILRFVVDDAGNVMANGVIDRSLEFDPTTETVVVTPWGELFVALSNGHYGDILRYTFDSNGNAVPNGVIETNRYGSSNPSGMVFSPWGELFVAGPPQSILRYTFDSSRNATFNGRIADGSFNYPTGVAFSPWGELFVANRGGGISRFKFDAAHSVPQGGVGFVPSVPLTSIKFFPQAGDPIFIPPPPCDAQLTAANLTIQNQQGEIAQLNASIASLQAQLATATLSIQNQQNQIAQLNANIASLQAQLHNLTAQGTNVVVRPIDTTTGLTPATLTFSQVAQAGTTNLVIGSSGPAPPFGFQLGTPPTFYDLTTTASFSGPVTVCLDYSNVSFQDESQLGLFHFENGLWIDHTTSLDTTNNVICGNVTSLSPFAIFKGGIVSLIQQVANLNLSNADKTSLTNKLTAAKQALVNGNRTGAINKMNAFIAEVQTLKQKGRLNSAVADSLILQAQAVLSTI